MVAVLTGIGMLPDGEPATANDQQPAAGLAAGDDESTTPSTDSLPAPTTSASPQDQQPDVPETSPPSDPTPTEADTPKEKQTAPTDRPDELA